MARANGEVQEAAALDRSLTCHITDLDVTFAGRLQDGRIEVRDTRPGPPVDKAQIRLSMKGDDLVALVNGELNFAKAWASAGSAWKPASETSPPPRPTLTHNRAARARGTARARPHDPQTKRG